MAEGVNIHLLRTELEENTANGGKTDTFLLQHPQLEKVAPLPGMGQTETALSLTDRESFYDEINGIRIEQLDHNTSSARVRVTFGTGQCSQHDPAISVQAAGDNVTYPGGPVDYTVTVSNMDSSACPASTFALDDVVPGGWTGTFSPASLTLASGEEGTVTWTVDSPEGVADGIYDVTSIATDTADAAFADSEIASFIVSSLEPRPPNMVHNNISAGFFHVCAIYGGGKIKCWGDNGSGQLGIGLTTPLYLLAPGADVVGITNAVKISVGRYFSCALLATGNVKCWGTNREGELGNGTTTSSPTPVDVCADASCQAPLSGVVDIGTGEVQTCAALASGNIKCWGDNSDGRLGDGTTTDRLTPADDVVGITNAIGVEAHGATCALLPVGTTPSNVKCWGLNEYGKLGDGTTTNSTVPVNVSGLNDAVSISVGLSHACAIKQDKTMVCWGSDRTGQLGSSVEFNDHSSIPVPVLGISNVLAMSADSYYHTCAVSDSGGGSGPVWCWGLNDNGELGDGTWVDSAVPVAVSDITNAIEVAVDGSSHSCAFLTTGAVKCWGWNSFGQLGNNDIFRNSQPEPVDVIGFP